MDAAGVEWSGTLLEVDAAGLAMLVESSNWLKAAPTPDRPLVMRVRVDSFCSVAGAVAGFKTVSARALRALSKLAKKLSCRDAMLLLGVCWLSTK
jgi:hypothetical protein